MTEERKPVERDELALAITTEEAPDEALEAAAVTTASAHVTSMWGHC